MTFVLIETGLSAGVIDTHRALVSLAEELEAIDSYHQRIDVSGDDKLKAILIHNRDEEMEHAAMLMAWLAKAMPGFGAQMQKFLNAGIDSKKP